MSDDVELVERYLKERDEDAVRALYEKYSARLSGFLIRYLGAESLVDDALQETFFRVVRSLKRYDRSRPFAAWLYRIALNAARDILASRRSTHSIDDSLAAELPEENDEELTKRVREALSELPEHHRSVFILYFWENLSYQEIADVLGCPVGTVKSRMHYASMTMREMLEGII